MISSRPVGGRSIAISWLSTEKRKQTQQKQKRIHNKLYYNIK